MISIVYSYGLSGIEGFLVDVEVDAGSGLPGLDIVGLPDAAVKESKERVRAAIKNAGFAFLPKRMIVNLAPGDRRKEGTFYDLPIALGILYATGQIKQGGLNETIVLGELSLDGDTKPVQGVLPIAIDAIEKGFKRILLPERNADEISCLTGIEIIPVQNLKQLALFLNGDADIPAKAHVNWQEIKKQSPQVGEFDLIKGQRDAKRALEIAAAGGHNVLLVGAPGSGKTMLARSLLSILPDVTFQEALEITKVYSICGMLDTGGIMTSRPFRAPHHSVSTSALTGGGRNAQPGEVSLASNGVLFLDEFAEIRRDALEALRQPLEDGIVSVVRTNARAVYPANFMLVAAMNPCPCGNLGNGNCACTQGQIQKYLARLSSPLLDRIDMCIVMAPVEYAHLTDAQPEESARHVKKRVQKARDVQTQRYEHEGIYSNSQLDNRLMKKYCTVAGEAEGLLKKAFESMRLSARAYNRILKVSRTIADMEGARGIETAHIAEAIQYRNHSSYWSIY